MDSILPVMEAASAMAGVTVAPGRSRTHDGGPTASLTLRFLRCRLRALIGQHRSQPERLESRLVGFLVEELPQAGIVGILAVGDFDRLALFSEIIVGLRDIHGADVPNGLLGRT